MNLPKFPVQTVLLGWMLLPVGGQGAPPAPALTEELARATADQDHASVAKICRRRLEQSPDDIGTLQELFRAQLDLEDTDRVAETLGRLDKTSASVALREELRGDLAEKKPTTFAPVSASLGSPPRKTTSANALLKHCARTSTTGA